MAQPDESDRELLANAHPDDWTNPTPAERYNLVAVGGGTAGIVAAVVAAGLGAKAALVERHRLGGLAQAGYLTNETVFSLDERPRRLIVVGAGPIGCELAQAFRRFGSEVHLVGRHESVLPKEPLDAARIVEDQFRREGIHLHL